VSTSPPARLEALTLAALRRHSGRSQAQVASAMGTTQSGVSRLERQADVRASTLQEYVVALGGRLRLVVELDGREIDLCLPTSDTSDTPDDRREYRVIWQDPTTRGFHHVGWLEHVRGNFTFSYTDEARSNAAFKPFPPFPLFDETYRASELFPFFAVRLISAMDPNFEAVLDALGLSRAEATPAELLAHSSAEPAYDTIQVVPEPVELPDRSVVRTFLASGVRHVDEQDPDGLSARVAGLKSGDSLDLVPEPSNPFNHRALRLFAGDAPVGWVPDYLVEEIHAYLGSKREVTLTVERANGPETPWHVRLLCRLTVAPPATSAGPLT
jgi:transcriptional regulator with XRE-family HTH domain